jgi:hypothetical protein
MITLPKVYTMYSRGYIKLLPCSNQSGVLLA